MRSWICPDDTERKVINLNYCKARHPGGCIKKFACVPLRQYYQWIKQNEKKYIPPKWLKE